MTPWHDPTRPVESHSEARETIIAVPYHNPITYALKSRRRRHRGGGVSSHYPTRSPSIRLGGLGEHCELPQLGPWLKMDVMHIWGQKEAIWNILSVFLSDGRAPKCHGARENSPPLDGPGPDVTQRSMIWWRNPTCLLNALNHKYHKTSNRSHIRTSYRWSQLVLCKVTICPKFFGTVPNFEGQSRKKYEVIRDAELSRVPNPAPNLSWFNVKICCSSSSWWKCSCSFWHFCLSEMCFVKLKTHKILFQLGLGSLGCSPIYPIVGWQGDRDGDTPSPCISILVSSPPRKVSLDFCHRFMVTLSHHPACIITDYK